jgi:hypothetical protein
VAFWCLHGGRALEGAKRRLYKNYLVAIHGANGCSGGEDRTEQARNVGQNDEPGHYYGMVRRRERAGIEVQVARAAKLQDLVARQRGGGGHVLAELSGLRSSNLIWCLRSPVSFRWGRKMEGERKWRGGPYSAILRSISRFHCEPATRPTRALMKPVSNSDNCKEGTIPTMALDLAYPPPKASPETAVRITQKAPQLLKSSFLSLPWPLSLLAGDQTTETFLAYETLYMQCLRTGDDKTARQILDKLTARFGDKNERVMAYQGLWEESQAKNNHDLFEVLKTYGQILQNDATNIVSIAPFVQSLRQLTLRSPFKSGG